MEPTPMYKAMRMLRSLERSEMLSLAHAYLLSQMQVNGLLSLGAAPHLSASELSDRVERLTDGELISLLMPIAALGRGGLRRDTYQR